MNTMSIAQFETQNKPSSAAYGKKRNGGVVTEGRLTTTRTGETFEKSVLLSYESALALQRILNANPDIESAELKRDHHSPNTYYVRYRVTLSADAGRLTGDLNLRRSLHRSGEFRSEPLPDNPGAFLVVHVFPAHLGGGCTIYTANREGSCTCPQSRIRRETCKHVLHLRATYPLTADRGDVKTPRKRTESEITADFDSDYP